MSFYTTGINSPVRVGELEMKKQFLGFVLLLLTTPLIVINIFTSDKVFKLFIRKYNNETFPSKTILFQADLLWTGIIDKTRNCLTWDVVNITQHFSEKNTAVKYIEDDSEEPHHRLKSWKKAFILKIII